MAGGGCPNLNGLSSGAQSKMGSTLNFIYLDNEITVVEVTAIALLRSGGSKGGSLRACRSKTISDEQSISYRHGVLCKLLILRFPKIYLRQAVPFCPVDERCGGNKRSFEPREVNQCESRSFKR